MWKEIKISLPVYKLVYALFFVVILSFIRGVSYSYEIGIALEPAMAILASVFCADTYVQEIISKRSEIHRLYPMKKRIASIIKRIISQELFLLLLAIIGYGLFLVFQNPQKGTYEIKQFVLYFAAITVTLGFWGILSNTIACYFGNIWFGIGGSLIVWMIENSTFGERYFGSWNLFSYTFHTENINDLSWICGKGICIIGIIFMILVLPNILKKRG